MQVILPVEDSGTQYKYNVRRHAVNGNYAYFFYV